MLGDFGDAIAFAVPFAVVGGTVVAAAMSRTPWSVIFLKYWIIAVLGIIGLTLVGAIFGEITRNTLCGSVWYAACG